MARPQTPAAEALAKAEALMAGYKASGLTRRQYCQREGIPPTTFDYYQRRRRELREHQDKTAASAAPGGPRQQRLLPVKLQSNQPAMAPEHQFGFVLTLAKGRRVEAGWGFREEDLARLIRTIEEA